MISPRRATIATIALTGLLALGACATTPGALQGTFTAVTPQQVQSGQYVGDTVRWGGLIVKTTPGKTETCFRVVGMRLGRNGAPLAASRSNADGRFLACAKGFFDPEIYASGRRITFVGTITGIQHEKIGNYDYPYPRLEASVVHLWPHETMRTHAHAYYMNGWWGPYGTWGWWPWAGFSTWGAWGAWGAPPPPYYRYPDPDDAHRHRHKHTHSKPPRIKLKHPWRRPSPPTHRQPSTSPVPPVRAPSHPPRPPMHPIHPVRPVRPVRPERPVSASPPEPAHYRSAPHHPHKPPR